jgi:type IV pilus assembly protein PilO
VRELRIVAANMKRFQAEAAKLREELQMAITQLPTSKEIPTLLSNVSELGKESGLEFLLFRPAAEVSREFYAEIPVEIRVKGTYHNVALFFDRVGRLPRIVNISEVSMENAKEAFGRWEINTACTATTFKFIEKPAELAKEKEKKTGESKGTPPKKP